MATAVIYVDEAGNPDSHRQPLVSGETPLFTLTGKAFAATRRAPQSIARPEGGGAAWPAPESALVGTTAGE